MFCLAGHSVRLVLLATCVGWLAVGCCALAAVLPFVGGVLVLVALCRAAPTRQDRARALLRARLRGEGVAGALRAWSSARR